MAQLEERFGALETSSRDMVSQVGEFSQARYEKSNTVNIFTSGEAHCSSTVCEKMVLWIEGVN